MACAGQKSGQNLVTLLAEKHFEPWLRGEAGHELLVLAPEGVLQRWPVSQRVNSSRADTNDATLIDKKTGMAEELTINSASPPIISHTLGGDVALLNSLGARS